MSYQKKGPEPPMHFHPNQFEIFYVLQGQLTVRLGSDVRAYKKGERISIPRNTAHAMWNAADHPVTVRWEIAPALNTETFFETLFDMDNPNFLDKLWLAKNYATVFRLERPPILLIRLMYYLLYPVIFFRRKTLISGRSQF